MPLFEKRYIYLEVLAIELYVSIGSAYVFVIKLYTVAALYADWWAQEELCSDFLSCSLAQYKV